MWILAAIFIAKFSIRPQELFQSWHFYTFSDDILIIYAKLKHLNIYVLSFTKLFQSLFSSVTAAS